jgi:teichuronic acid biosynthesis glycosyltransferase TuaC
MIEAFSTREAVGKPAAPQSRIRILSLSLLYPNPSQPNQGVFIQRRLKQLARIVELQIVSPFALVQYGNPRGERVRIGNTTCPVRRQDGTVAVLHPRWFYPPFSGSLTAFWLFAQLLYRIRRLRQQFAFDILDAHFGFPDGVAGSLLASALNIPFTITLRGNEPKHSRSALGRISLARALRRASRVFAVSETLRTFAIEMGAAADKVRTIPNGVEGAIFWPREKQQCRAKHGLPSDARVIVSAGALVERKGHHRVIEALKTLVADGLPAQLLIVGGPGPEGTYEGELHRLVTSLDLEDRVRFCGPVDADTMAELMSAADIFCLASANEGWPNVVHEALACGTPVVATKVGAIPEMLASGRGLIVPLNEPSQLKEALSLAFQMNWDRAAASAWARARSWEEVASELYHEMEMIVQTRANRTTA